MIRLNVEAVFVLWVNYGVMGYSVLMRELFVAAIIGIAAVQGMLRYFYF